ncbi:hypothetical protein [Haloarchaeobius sp. HME9146]|uniref:hypothetical protein n=1 Tax=Haloarchaeobius sp. HME9146 TaxID=2978732 RepID=UPI0021BFEB0E|nr:hypothetical protein [Haloarchaeobius sp. HME9146]MCT9097413.1 hypothetical protein [Haloarchaeobius sp. HME9146]
MLKTAGLAVVGTGIPITGVARASEGITTVLEQDFEDIGTGGYPADWSKQGNHDQRVTDQFAGEGQKSLMMSGSPGGCWEALADVPADVPAEGQTVISGMIRPTTSGRVGCHDSKGQLQFRTRTGWWGAGSGIRLFRFYKNGEVQTRGERVTEYTENEWHDFEVVYERTKPDGGGNGTITQTVTVDGDSHTVEYDAPGHADDFSYVRLGSGDFDVYFDDITIETGPIDESGPATATVDIADDAKLVQTVTNTRLNSDEDSSVPDPQVVAGVDTSVAFGLVTDGLADLPDSAEVPISVSTPDGSVGDVALTRAELETLADADRPATALADVFEGQTPPVFTPGPDFESVTIEVQDASGDGWEVTGGEPVTLEAGPDFQVVEMPELRIGLGTVKAATTMEGGEEVPQYGDTDTGTFTYDEDGYESLTEALHAFGSDLEDYLLDEYPTAQVDVKVLEKPIQGSGTQGYWGMIADMDDVYEQVYGEYDVDVALALVPNGDGENESFYTHHYEAANGVEPMMGLPELLQPQEAASVRWRPEGDAAVETAAQEIAHHFLPTNAYSGDYTFDGNHVHPSYSNAEYGVVSTAFDISADTYEATDGLFSFMSYAAETDLEDTEETEGRLVADALSHQKLIDTGFDPHPMEIDRGPFSQTGTVISGLFDTTSGEVFNVSLREGGPLPSAKGSDIVVRVKDGSGEVLDERHTARVAFTHDGTGSETSDVAQFVVPFGDTAATVEIVTGDTRTTFDPVSKVLSEMIASLPDAAFENNPDSRRETLQLKLDAVHGQVDEGAYRGAANKLENDVLDKLHKWLVDVEPTAANVPSTQTVIDQCDQLVDHIQRLAERAGNEGPADDHGNGKGKDNAPPGTEHGNGDRGDNGGTGRPADERGNGTESPGPGNRNEH